MRVCLMSRYVSGLSGSAMKADLVLGVRSQTRWFHDIIIKVVLFSPPLNVFLGGKGKVSSLDFLNIK